MTIAIARHRIRLGSARSARTTPTPQPQWNGLGTSLGAHSAIHSSAVATAHGTASKYASPPQQQRPQTAQAALRSAGPSPDRRGDGTCSGAPEETPGESAEDGSDVEGGTAMEEEDSIPEDHGEEGPEGDEYGRQGEYATVEGDELWTDLRGATEATAVHAVGAGGGRGKPQGERAACLDCV